jgi:hypothetical protein
VKGAVGQAPALVRDGVVWPHGRSAWVAWTDPPSLEPVLAAGRQSAAVSVWAGLGELAGRAWGDGRLTDVVDALGIDPGDHEMRVGAPVRFLAAPVEEVGRLARAALWMGSALDQTHGPASEESELPFVRAAIAGVGAALGAESLCPAPAHRLAWLWAALEWDGSAVEESGRATVIRHRGRVLTQHAFLLGAVEDGAWPVAADHMPFPVNWSVRRAPELASDHGHGGRAAGILALSADRPDVLEARVEQLRDVYLAGGRALVRPREQLALAAAMAPWSGLARRLWRPVSRSLART